MVFIGQKVLKEKKKKTTHRSQMHNLHDIIQIPFNLIINYVN